jgi:hypothetical protein
MFPEDLKKLDIYTPEKEAEILDVLKNFFVVTSIGKDNPKPGIACCSICKYDNSGAFEGSYTLYTTKLMRLKCQSIDYTNALYLAHRDYSTNKSSEVDSILNGNATLKEGFSFPYMPGLYPATTGNKTAPKIDTKKKKLKLNLDQSLENYLEANDMLKKMFLHNPNKTLRVLKKIYFQIMIEGNMIELAESDEELKTLKKAFWKVQSKKYRPDLRTDIFAKMRCACDDTGASYEKLKTLNGAKGGYSKAAKGKFAEK